MATIRHSAVVVVGAGPTGLALACELALAGLSCLVLDRRPGPRADSRAICLHARSMEMLDLRGQADKFIDAGLPVPSFPLGLKGAAISFARLDSDFPYILDIPQSKIENLLKARALELGARIQWSAQVTGIEQNPQCAAVTLADGTVCQASYVVGCDGTRSFVREAVGIPFPGAANPGSVILADLHLSGLGMGDAHGELSQAGMLLVFPFRDGACRVVLYDSARASAGVDEPVTLDEVRESLIRITGQDAGARDMEWSGRYRSESRQATTYRSGRIFLAGDAAHSHSPAGAQGMNTGLQDALNLGWKLAGAHRGWAPDWLLDTYHAERHPVGADVLALTGRQFKLNTARTRAGRALRWAAQRMIAPLPPVQSSLARSYSGVAVRYPPGPAATHPWAGVRLPPGRVTLSDGSSARLYDLFHDGTFVLFQPQDVPGLPRVPDPVRSISYRTAGSPLPAALLVRPDGYVAWASDERDASTRSASASAAVRAWCGAA